MTQQDFMKILKEFNILYVEDDVEVASSLLDVSKIFFKNIDYAKNGQEALDLYNQNSYEILITDINMPVMNGIELIQHIRSCDKNIQILIISAHGESNYFIDAIRLEVNGFILKPIEYEQLFGQLQRFASYFLYKKNNQKNLQLLNEYKEAIDKSAIVSKTDLDGVITYANDEFLRISGYTKTELLGQSHSIVRHEDMSDDFFKQLWETIVDKEVWRGKIKNKKKDGSYYWVEVTIKPLLDENNNIIEYIAIRYDITLQMQKYEELQQLVDAQVQEIRKKDAALQLSYRQAAMGEMIDAIAHQWKQPLNFIKMNMEMLGYDFDDNLIDKSYIQDFQKHMISQVNHMNSTLNEFRSFLRPSNNQALFSVHDLIESVLVLLKDELVYHNIKVELDEKNNCIFYGQQNELKHIILNIINNAKDAFITNKIPHRVIVITTQSDEEISMMSITDNAGGIPEAIINEIFKANFTTKFDQAGTGIGLYMSQQIANKNQCELVVQNVSEGAQFTLIQKRSNII